MALYLQLPPHRHKKSRLVAVIELFGFSFTLAIGQLVEVNVAGRTLQKVARWLSKPPPTITFKPAEMSTCRSCAEDCVRVLLELWEWKRLADGDLGLINTAFCSVVLGNLQDRLRRVRQIMGSSPQEVSRRKTRHDSMLPPWDSPKLDLAAPCRTRINIEPSELCRHPRGTSGLILPHAFTPESAWKSRTNVFNALLFEQSPHVCSHCFRVHFKTKPRSLQCNRSDFEIPRIRHNYSSFQWALTTFFAKVLHRGEAYQSHSNALVYL